MKDPKEVMRTYTKAEFPELTKALDGLPTVTEREYQELKRDRQADYQAMKDGAEEIEFPTKFFLTPEITLDEVKAALHYSMTHKSRIADDLLLSAAREAMAKSEILNVLYVSPEETPLPYSLQLLLEQGLVVVERRTPEQQRRANATDIWFVTDEIQDFQMGDESEGMRIKKSQSTNPSDRWIKPKKLRRAKGGRK